jgi:NAD(P)-dependent dehydrogenase (short-subunit alcohol dehydrogenase family)
MVRRFDGKVIMVTGAGTGLGRAAALRLAQEGARLSLIDIDAHPLEDSRETILGLTSAAEMLLITADVSNENEVKSYVEQTKRHFGRIDGLSNNAGLEGKQNPVDAYDSEMVGRVIDVNLKGVFYGMKHTLPYLKAQGSGAIVNAASVGGIRAVPNQVAYGASKHAVAGMTKDAAIE